MNGNSDVSLDLELQFRALQSQSFNGVPVISNREYKGSISLKDGEPAVVAGAVSRTEQRSLNGIPGLGSVPGLNQVMTSNSKENDEDELLILITPRVVEPRAEGERGNLDAEVSVTGAETVDVILSGGTASRSEAVVERRTYAFVLTAKMHGSFGRRSFVNEGAASSG